MNGRLFATATIAAMLLVSCTDNQSTSQMETTDTSPPSSSDHESAPAEDALSQLVLDDGAKWKMDAHTRTMFVQMAESFSRVDPASASEEGLKAAGLGLQTQISELVQGCTMKGAAHDQLHVYLMGYIPAVAELSESGRSEDARQVKHYLDSYGEFFE